MRRPTFIAADYGPWHPHFFTLRLVRLGEKEVRRQLFQRLSNASTNHSNKENNPNYAVDNTGR
jgi:hypothetical protein